MTPGRAMALNLARLSQDWHKAYGHPLVLVESFVDSQLFRCTAHKASGWKELQVKKGHGRIEWRGIQVMEITPEQMGFPHAVQGEYRVWARRQPRARDSTCPAFLEKMSRRVDLVLRYLLGDVSRL